MDALEIKKPKLVIRLLPSKVHISVADGNNMHPILGESELDDIMIEHQRHGERGEAGFRDLQRKLALFMNQVRTAPASAVVAACRKRVVIVHLYMCFASQHQQREFVLIWRRSMPQPSD